jgi:hypothetical protein
MASTISAFDRRSRAAAGSCNRFIADDRLEQVAGGVPVPAGAAVL